MAGTQRTQVILVCQECKEQNHFMDKNKKLHPDRVELKKYCPHCRKTTVHREKK